MWIRSQDKKMVMKVENIYIAGREILTDPCQQKSIILGVYDTEERAERVFRCLTNSINWGDNVIGLPENKE